jgi:hypothetical protein
LRINANFGSPAKPYSPLVIVADILKWNASPDEALAWKHAFDTLLEVRAGHLISLTDEDGCLRPALTLLPTEVRKRFLRAPAVSALLLRRDEKGCRVEDKFNGQRFSELLIAELVLAGALSENPVPCWSAHGDCFVERSGSADVRCRHSFLGRTTILVDSDSPFHFPDEEDGVSAITIYDQRERAIVEERLLESFERLLRSCAQGLNLVTTFVDVVALRRKLRAMEKTSNGFYSSTFWGYPSLVRLTNSHLPEVSTEMLMEAAVHEAIHCLLHVYEELESPFVVTSEGERLPIVSPWTGVTIPLRSYIHACAVWYGIYWLWSTVQENQPCDNERVHTLRERALRGFYMQPVTVGLAGFECLLTENATLLLHEMERRMVEVCRALPPRIM